MSSEAINIEEAKAFLSKDTAGINLYDHLSDVLLKILIEKPENACDAFEHISEAVKQARYVSSNEKSIDDNNKGGPCDEDAVRGVIISYTF